MEHLGLGIEINLTDGFTIVSQNIVNSFNNVENAADNMVQHVTDSFTQLNALNNAGQEIADIGETLKGIGESGVEAFKTLGEHVIETSSEFENLRASLDALYGSSQKGDEMFAWAQQMSIKFPMTVQQVMDSIVKFQGAGVDITHTLQDGYGALNMISDMQKGLNKPIPNVQKAIEEVVDTNNWLEMQRGMGIARARVEEMMGQQFSTGQTGQDQMQRYDLLMSYIEKRFGNLSIHLQQTWSTLSTNFQDLWQLWLYNVGGETSGFYKDFENTMFGLYNFLKSHQDELNQVARALGSGLQFIWDILKGIVPVIESVVSWFAQFSTAHPEITKVAVALVAIGSGLAAVTGTLLIFAGNALSGVASLGIFMLTLQMAEAEGITFSTIFEGIGASLLTIVPTIALLAGGAILLYEAWTNNFLGIRDKVTQWFLDMKDAFTQLWDMLTAKDPQQFAQMWNSFGDNFQWVDSIVQGVLILRYAFDQLFNVTPSNNLLSEMNTAGLSDKEQSIKQFADNVKAFFDGMGQGISAAWNGVIHPAIDGIVDVFNSLFSIVQNIASTFGVTLNNMGTNKWQEFGQVVGYVGTILVASKIAESLLAIGKAMMFVNAEMLANGFSKLGSLFSMLATVSGLLLDGLLRIPSVLTDIGTFLIKLKDVPAILDAIISRIAVFTGPLFQFFRAAAAWFTDLGSALARIGGAIWDLIGEPLMVVFRFIGEAVLWIVGAIAEIFAIPEEIVAAIIVGIVALGIIIATNWGHIVNFFKTAWDDIVSVWNKVADWFSVNVAQPIATRFEQTWRGISNVAQFVWDVIKGIWIDVSTWFDATVFQPLKKKWDAFWNEIELGWQYIINQLKTDWQDVVAFWQQDVVEPTKQLWNEFWNYLQQQWQDAMTALQNWWSPIADWWNTTIVEPVKKFMTALWQAVEDDWNAAVNAFKQVWGVISSWWNSSVTQPVNNDVTLIQTSWNNTIDSMWSKITAVLGQIKSWWSDNITKPVDDGMNWLQQKWGALQNGANQIIQRWHDEGANNTYIPPSTSSSGFIGPTIPKAATGGYIPVEGLVDLHPGEVVMNADQVTRMDDFLRNIGSNYQPFSIGEAYQPITQTHATNNNTVSATHDASIHIQELHFHFDNTSIPDPRAHAQQVLAELKKLQAEEDMLTYTR